MSKNNYSLRFNPLTPETLTKLHGRGEQVLFWQGTFQREKWHNCAFLNCRFEDINFLANTISGISFFQCFLKNVSFAGSVLRGILFNEATLEEVDFRACDLQGVSFYKARLVNCTFSESQFTFVDFSGAELINCAFNKTNLQSVNLDNCELIHCTYNHQTKLNWTKSVAETKGLVFKPSHLTLVSDSVKSLAPVIPFPTPKSPTPAVQPPATPAQVINLVDYFAPKPPHGDGPKIA